MGYRLNRLSLVMFIVALALGIQGCTAVKHRSYSLHKEGEEYQTVRHVYLLEHQPSCIGACQMDHHSWQSEQ